MNKLNTPVLVLNKGWSPVHAVTVENAIRALCRNKVRAVDPENYFMYPWQADAENPVGWVDMPVIGEMPYITYTLGRKLRMPKIVTLAKYDKMPKFKVKLNLKNVWLRDGGRCMYSGRKVSLSEATMDHVIPEAQGGPKSWDNIVCCCPVINRRKANRTPKQFGMPLLRKPFEPKWTPLYSSIFSGRTIDPSWAPFVKLDSDDLNLLASAFDD